MKRLTFKMFLEFINSEFDRFELPNIRATNAYRTNYRSQDYENGAATIVVKVENKSSGWESSMLCFYFLKDYQNHIDHGYEMYLKLHTTNYSLVLIDESTIELRKKS